MNISNYVTGLQHIGIPTKRLAETIDFFRLIGFEVVHETTNPNNRKNVAFLQCRNTCIEVYESDDVAAACGAVEHIAMDVTDIERVFEIVSSLGVKLLDKSIQELPFWENGVRFFTVEGPNKEKVEFSQML